jgi:hypothetical protein
MKRSLLTVCALGTALVAGPALAQTTSSPAAAPPASVGTTVNGGLPDRTASTTAVGQTKPAGAAVGDDLGTRPDLQQRSRELDRRIDKGICTGCK